MKKIQMNSLIHVLPIDIINNILEFILTNKDMCNFRKTCKYFYDITEQKGYIRELFISMADDYRNYIILLDNSQTSLKTLTVEGLENAFQWIPISWPKTVNFKHCLFPNNLLIPPKNSITEELNIDININKYFCFNMDFTKLPKLKSINIKVPDMNLNTLKNCNNLENIVIELYRNDKKELPEFISQLPKLRKLIINCEAKKPLHFISPFLKKLFFYKLFPCTSLVKTIPPRHLRENINFNVSVMQNI